MIYVTDQTHLLNASQANKALLQSLEDEIEMQFRKLQKALKQEGTDLNGWRLRLAFEAAGELYKNAIDSVLLATYGTDERRQVGFSILADPQSLVFAVDDHGYGFDKKVERTVLETRAPFSTKTFNSPVPVMGGAGMGLRKTRTWIDTLHGAFGYFSKGQGRGMVMWFEIPLKELEIH